MTAAAFDTLAYAEELQKAGQRTATVIPFPNCRALPPGLEIGRCDGYDTYTGTREALIAAGVAKEDWFPEGRKRVVWHWDSPDTLSRRPCCVERARGGRFRVLRWPERTNLRKALTFNRPV